MLPFLAGFDQIAYVTNDLARACTTFGDYGIPRFHMVERDLDVAVRGQRGTMRLKLGFAAIVPLFQQWFSVPEWLQRGTSSTVMGEWALFALFALGLNVVVGFAGLLDLGYVAFWAIGSYTAALLSGAVHYSKIIETRPGANPLRPRAPARAGACHRRANVPLRVGAIAGVAAAKARG